MLGFDAEVFTAAAQKNFSHLEHLFKTRVSFSQMTALHCDSFCLEAFLFVICACFVQVMLSEDVQEEGLESGLLQRIHWPKEVLKEQRVLAQHCSDKLVDNLLANASRPLDRSPSSEDYHLLHHRASCGGTLFCLSC